MSSALSLEHARLLERVDLFAHLDRVTLARLASYVEPVALAAGAEVVRQGDEADGLYVVAHGTLGIFVGSEGGPTETRLGVLLPGDCFGEMALLTGERRSATVRAEGDAEVLRLEQGRFHELLKREPAIALAIAAMLSRRLGAADRSLLESDQALNRRVEQVLEALEPDRRRQVLEASVLDEVSIPSLRTLFGEDAEAVARNLEELGVQGGQLSSPVLRVLRERFEREAGADRFKAFAQDVASRLAGAQLWDDALSVVARHAPRPAFVSLLAQAYRGVPPLSGERSARWLARITDEEAADDVELAMAKAQQYQERGDADGAARLLQRALGKALVSGDSASGARLSAALATISTASGATRPAGLGYGLQPMEVLRRRPSGRTALAIVAAVGLVAAAVVLRGAGPQWVFSLLLAAALVLWTNELFGDAAVAFGLVAAWLLFDIANPAQAFAGFGSMNWVFILAVYGIAAAVARSGLLFRVGLLLVRRMPHGLLAQAVALLLTGLLLSPLLPSSSGRAALAMPLALAVAEALHLREREPAAAVLGLAAWLGAGPLLFMFLNASSVCLLAWGLLPEDSRNRFDWLHWLGAALPLGIFTAIGGLTMLFVVLRPGQASKVSRQRVDVQLAVLGALSRCELTMIAVLVLTLAGWIAAPILHVDVGTVAILGLLGAVLTGNFDRSAFRELDWNYMIFFGVALSMSGLIVSLGLDRVASDQVGALLGQFRGGPLLFIIAVAALSLLARFILPQDHGILLLSLALIPAAPGQSVDPWIVVIALLATSTLWFLPNQTPSYLVAFAASEGRLYSQAQARRVAAAYTAVTLVGLILSVPYWHLLGLL